MSYRPTLRAALTLAFALIGYVLATHGTARALSEFCPASSGGFYRIGDASSSLYSFVVDAEGPRTVSGTIVVKTDTGWFNVPFAQATMIERDEQWRDEFVSYSRRSFGSAPLYVRFPQPEHIIDSFVLEATASGDPYFGWDSKGDVQCSAPAGFGIVNTLPRAEAAHLLNPRTDVHDPPPANAIVPTASISSIPGSTDCQTPFAQAAVTKPVSPNYPLGYNITTEVLVEVLVDASGALADSWVFKPSGYTYFDQAALESARKSTYQAGTAFCKPAPGKYIFRAKFNAN